MLCAIQTTYLADEKTWPLRLLSYCGDPPRATLVPLLLLKMESQGHALRVCAYVTYKSINVYLSLRAVPPSFKFSASLFWAHFRRRFIYKTESDPDLTMERHDLTLPSFLKHLKTVNSMWITGTITVKQKWGKKSQAFTRFAGRFQSHT